MSTSGDYRPPHLAAVVLGDDGLLVARCEDCSDRLETHDQSDADGWVRVHSRGDLRAVPTPI